jgi:purine-cytosine permease-like protein
MRDDSHARDGGGEKRGLIESRSIEYVPLSERHGKVWHLWPVWFTGDAHLATLATGLIGVALGLPLLWSAVAIVTGCAFGTFFMAFHATQGPQLGLPQMIQSRPQFGYRGALLVWVVAVVTFVGFNAFNLLLAGDTLHFLTGIAGRPAYLAFAALALGLAIVGHDWIHAAQRIVAAVMIVALLIFSIAASVDLRFSAAQMSWDGFRATPFLSQFFAAAAYQLSWSIYVSDYSRYLPRDVGVAESFWWTYSGALIGGAWMMLVGMLVGVAAPGTDVARSVVTAGNVVLAGFGSPLLVCCLLGLVTITSLNFYGASLTLLSIADSLAKIRFNANSRLLSLALVGLAAPLVAVYLTGDFASRFSDLLALLLYLFTPWTAINLVDFYVVRHGHYSVREIFRSHGLYGQWNWRGLTAYGVGFVAMVPFFSTGLYVGPLARALGGADIAMVVGLPVSALVYLLACRSLDVAEDRRLAAAADIGLEVE